MGFFLQLLLSFLLWSSWVPCTAVMLGTDMQLFKAACKAQALGSTNGATNWCLSSSCSSFLGTIWLKFTTVNLCRTQVIPFKAQAAKPTTVDCFCFAVKSEALPATMLHLKVNIKQFNIRPNIDRKQTDTSTTFQSPAPLFPHPHMPSITLWAPHVQHH